MDYFIRAKVSNMENTFTEAVIARSKAIKLKWLIIVFNTLASKLFRRYDPLGNMSARKSIRV